MSNTKVTIPRTDRVAFLKAAREEGAKFLAWKKAGQKGSRPDTPHYDVLERETAGLSAKPRGTGDPTAKTSKPKVERTRKASDGPVQYFHDGIPMCAANNALSSLAWQYTKGLSKESPKRIGTTDLRALLLKGGVDPDAEKWDYRLSNGVTLSRRPARVECHVPRNIEAKQAAATLIKAAKSAKTAASKTVVKPSKVAKAAKTVKAATAKASGRKAA